MNRSEIRGGVDTSVLMRLLTGQPAPLAKSAFEFLAEVEDAGAGLFVSNLVASETYFACQHHYGMTKEDVIHGPRALLSQRTFVVHPALLDVLALKNIATAKPGFLDRIIHGEYETSGLPLVTFEKSATRLPGTRVLPGL